MAKTATKELIRQRRLKARRREAVTRQEQRQEWTHTRSSAKNPDRDDPFPWPEWPEDGDWVEVRMVVQRLDGKRVDAHLLRPASWAASLRVGDSVPVVANELEVNGHARILSIEPTSPPEPGPGNPVIGKFVTHGIESLNCLTIANGETLEGTPNHPVWHVDRGEFVPMAEFEAGDHVLTDSGPMLVIANRVRATNTSVYNLEVASEHVYQIGVAGVLVHNTGDDCPLVQIQVPSTLRPGPYAKESIPAHRGRPTAQEQRASTTYSISTGVIPADREVLALGAATR